jgi:hypothetical protein
MEDFQRGEAKTYVEHIEAGVQRAVEDGKSLLVFAGYGGTCGRMEGRVLME